MSPAEVERIMHETSLSSVGSRRFGGLRGVRWRIDMGILPSSSSASIDDLRRVTASSRRSYAALRKQLLVDPHLPKDGGNSPDLVMDNPLSQNPDSMWSRFFRNAELERMVDQDLTRLYPERGGYFQTSGCQVMLRRILLLWCLKHPEYGYRQGMHELLAPLLYVLHVDVEHLLDIRKLYENHFADKFDGFSYNEKDLGYKFDFKKFSEYVGDEHEVENTIAKAKRPTELDPAAQTIVFLCDAYGTEGELGVVLSEKFMEHDAYAMFDALMSGMGGAVSMAEFFSPSPYSSLHITPVIEASTLIYNLLVFIDSPLHTHLVELGVEPQFFSMRWLRVLFGREFSLEDLLLIWDEIFTWDNTKFARAVGNDTESNLGILDSPRGAFISAFAVSMILQLRSSLLASDNATACLQKLLNFPEDVDFGKMVTKAKALQPFAVKVISSTSLVNYGWHDDRKSMLSWSHSLQRDPLSPRTPLNVVPDSYWEEKWRISNEEEERRRSSMKEHASNVKRAWLERVRLLRLPRTASKKKDNSKIPKPSVGRNILDNLSQQLGLDEGEENPNRNDVEHLGSPEGTQPTSSCSCSEGNSTYFSDASSPQYLENESESSSIVWNSPIDGKGTGSCRIRPCCSPLPVSDFPDGHSSICSSQNDISTRNSAEFFRERNPSLSDRLQWLWTFGKNGDEDTYDPFEASKAGNSGSDKNISVGACTANKGCFCTNKGETVDQNLILSLRNLGQSMLENIQVIEAVLQLEQQDFGQIRSPKKLKNGVVSEGEVRAVSALKELRKISSLLSEV